MTAPAAITCPRCLASVEAGTGMKFCRHCGGEFGGAETTTAPPIELRAGDLDVVVRERFAFGLVANLYHCSIRNRGQGVFKVARTATANKHLAREHAVLTRLHAADVGGRFAPFLPRVVGTRSYAAPPDEPQRANVLAYHPGIHSPAELYSLEEVRAAYPKGIDPRDMAWIWRRLLTVLGFVHDQQTIHTCVTPDHVLIEPREHKLVLVGWCGAVRVGETPVLVPPRFEDWRGGAASFERGASPAGDLRAAAKTMSYLLGEHSEPAVERHLERAAESTSANAWRLLEDFDRMIEALWGPRQFRTFTMPPRAASNHDS
jgi:hypothetical protein